jgi:hypothetical protein
MEQNSIWKNFLLLIVGGLLAMHVDFAQAAQGPSTSQTSDSETSDSCVLEQE